MQPWLSGHPGIKIVSRDRSGGYGEAVTKAIPDAIQVADRRHLMESAIAAFLDAVRRSMRGIRAAIGATMVNPVLLTSAERLRFQGYLRRQKACGTIASPLSATKYRSKGSSAGQGAAATLSARSVERGHGRLPNPSEHARQAP